MARRSGYDISGVTMTSISSLNVESRLFKPSDKYKKNSLLPNFDAYKKMYDASLSDPDKFWGDIASDFFWFKKWDQVFRYDWSKEIKHEWFIGGQTNLCVNALERHLATKADQTALLWVGNECGESKKISYRQLYSDVCRFGNVLKNQGIKKGDRITIYMPMIPEAAVAMLACARIGAVHSVVFGGFSAEAIKDRLIDAESSVLITCDGGYRGSKTIPLKQIADEAMELCQKANHTVATCLVFERTKESIKLKQGRDYLVKDLLSSVSDECPAEMMDAEDPLFILYTSGSTGRPKGVLHTTAGYMIHAATSFKYIFDYQPGEVFWCTADVGWVTGHSYLLYGPLCNGATTLMFEGIPNYPEPDRFWQVIEEQKVSIFYTAPTAIRALMREGEDWVSRHDLSSLRLLGSVGEPINPEAWIWYHENVGGGQCPIVDTWWQTETGGILISPLPGAMDLKPGSACFPFFGVAPIILKDDGTECALEEGGALALKQPWPGMMRTIYKQHDKFKDTYFSRFPELYFTGDGCVRDADGYYWLLGRIDDVLNVSGHRIGTAEVESAFVSHPSVAEAAVVGFPHDIKGQGIMAYVILKDGQSVSEKFLMDHVRKEIGAIAQPDKLLIVPGLPKTRSGKIMRRILRKIAEGETKELGDVTTLADPAIVSSILKLIG